MDLSPFQFRSGFARWGHRLPRLASSFGRGRRWSSFCSRDQVDAGSWRLDRDPPLAAIRGRPTWIADHADRFLLLSMRAPCLCQSRTGCERRRVRLAFRFGEGRGSGRYSPTNLLGLSSTQVFSSKSLISCVWASRLLHSRRDS
jgi:hypothetical protein